MSKDRRHSAIMFTDIVGYTSIMGLDEDRAFDMLERNRTIHQKYIEEFNGSLIKEIGDGMLASFSLASDAVRCAINIQKECSKQEIPLTIGIHEGEMVFEDNDVFGDGVNVASRIQEGTQGGYITISGSVYHDIKNKTGINTELIGERSFKNVEDSIKIYNVVIDEQSSITSKEVKSQPNQSKSIIVLPFVNMSPDPDQEFFSDGLTEEIITDLSFIQDLLVISRSSTMTFKGTGKTIKEIASKVNVRYVLEGSVRKAGNNLRITAQLIDASTDTHLWAEKYSGTLDDVFDIQEKVSRSIVNTLELHLSLKEDQRIQNHSFYNIAIYELYLKAKDDIFKFTEENITRAIRNLEHGLEITGDNAYLYTGLAFAYWNLVNIGIKQDEYLVVANDYAKKALKIESDFFMAHSVIGWINHIGNPQKSAFHLKRAIAINPDDSFAILGLLIIYTVHVGKISNSAPLLKKFLQVDPFDPMADTSQGAFYFYNGQFDKALTTFKKNYTLYPDNPYALFYYVLILCYHNKKEEALDIIDGSGLMKLDNVLVKLVTVFKYYLLNDKESMLQIMTKDFTKTCQRDPTFSHHLAGIFALLEEKEQSINWLEYAIQSGLINYPLFNEHDQWLNNIRGEKRFKKLMKKVKYEWENFEE